MKFLITVSLLISAVFLHGSEVTEEMKARVAGEAEQQQKVIVMFNKILTLKVNQGNEMALELAKKSQDNAGRVIIEFERMKEIMLKWDSSTAAEFKKLPTREEKILVIKNEFNALLKKKVDSKDEVALKLAQEGKLNGRIDLTVAEMKSFITKWTETETKSAD